MFLVKHKNLNMIIPKGYDRKFVAAQYHHWLTSDRYDELLTILGQEHPELEAYFEEHGFGSWNSDMIDEPGYKSWFEKLNQEFLGYLEDLIDRAYNDF